MLGAGCWDGTYYLCGYLKLLMDSAGLDVQLKMDMRHDPELEVNWYAVVAWNESSRYEKHGNNQAQDLHLAVNDPNHGILKWLKQHW